MNLAFPKLNKTISKQSDQTRADQKDIGPEATQTAGSLLDIKSAAENLSLNADCKPSISPAQFAYFLLLSRLK